MANGSTRLLCTSLLATLLLLLTTAGDASVTWRRVTMPTPNPETTTVVVSSTTSTTKSPVTWKRSTVVRRSTAAVERTERDTTDIESDEILEASSRHDDYVADEEIESDSEFKPLVPGSRPGFWFDSRRRKKPSSLLRPGDRRNSLFPSRSSTTTTPVPTTVGVTPLTVIPRTPPTVTTSNAKNTSTRQFGRTSSTKSPITFRRRPKTTKTPSQSSTTNIPNKQEKLLEDSDNLTHDDGMNDELDRNLKQPEDKADEDDDLRPKHPSVTIKRRPYNGTRLSWIRHNSRTTAVPKVVSTTSSERLSTASNNENVLRKSTRFPKTRTRLRVRTSPAPDVSEKAQTTVPPSTTMKDIKRVTDAKISRTALDDKEIKKAQNFKLKDSEEVDEEDKANVDQKSPLETSKLKLRTTVQPYFITREYGRVVTVVPDLKDKPIHRVVTTDNGSRKDNKPSSTKLTETPRNTSSPTITIETKDVELEYDNSADFTVEDAEEYKSIYTTVKPSPSPEIEKYVEKLQNDLAYHPVIRLSTTVSPVSQPTVPTIDPNSDAYVVWSLGEGGSGWSYQKHGGQVKWSAQNSEAEGDRWSVVGKDEAESIDADLSHQWIPVRNGSVPGHPKSDKIVPLIRSNGKNIQSARVKNNGEKSSSYVTYIPKLPYKNETILNIQTIPSEPDIPLLAQNISNSQFSPPAQYSTSVSIGGVKSLDSSHFDTNLNKQSGAFIRDSDAAPFTSQTPLPFSPTLEDKYNEQIEGILNQYPLVPNYTYVAEIRDTYNNKPNVATDIPTNPLEVQEYVTETVADNREKESTTPLPLSQAQWFSQEQQPNPYPTAYPQTGKFSPYVKFTSDDLSKEERIYNQATPVQLSHHNYLSNIPPELAKAVVDEKKWHVMGSGGDEGWSLLNEDGVLEWKIHNVDGKWKVTSAEQLVQMITPQQAIYTVNDEQISSNNTGKNSQPKTESLKVWTLEDDYAKWRAVSAERTNPADESEETSTSSEEYDYDSHEYQDYYGGNDYYSNIPPDTALNPNEDFGNRPIWGDTEYTIPQGYPKEDYPLFAGNIKFANSKEDAIAAWKSLVVQQGHWKFPDAVSNIHQTYPPNMPKYFQNKDRNAERISTQTPQLRLDKDRSKQTNKFYEVTKESNAKSTGYRFENYVVDLPKEEQSPIQLEKQKNYESMTKDENLVNGQHQFGGSGRHEEGKQKTYERKNEKLSEPRVRIRHKDRSKLDSLINKLETIQKEAKGRAVVDLTELLKQIKARRNATHVDLLSSRNANIKHDQRNVNIKNDQRYIDRNTNMKHDQRNIEINTNLKHDQRNIERNVKNDQSYTDRNTNIKQDQSNIEINTNLKHDERNLNIKNDQRYFDRNSNLKHDQRNIEINTNLKHDQRNVERNLNIKHDQRNIEKNENIKYDQRNIERNSNIKHDQRNIESYSMSSTMQKQNNANNPSPMRTITPVINQKNLDKLNFNRNAYDADGNDKNSLNVNKGNVRYDNRDFNNRERNSEKPIRTNGRKQPTEVTKNRRLKESDEQNDSVKGSYPPARPTEQYSRESDISGEQNHRKDRYNVPQNKVSSYFRQTGPVQKSAKIYTTSSEEMFVDLRGGKGMHQTNRYNVPQNKVSSYSIQTGPVVQKSSKSDTSSSEEMSSDLRGGKDMHQTNRYNVPQNKVSSYPIQTGPVVQKSSKSDTSSSEKISSDLRGKYMHQTNRYNVPQNKVSSYSRQIGPVQKSGKSDSLSSGEMFVDLRGRKDMRQTDRYDLPQNKMSSYSRQIGPVQKSTESDSSSSEETFVDLRGGKYVHQTDRYVPQNKVYSFSRQNESVQNSAKSDSSNSEEVSVDLRGGKETRNPPRRKRKLRKRTRRPNQPSPIVLKGETEVNEEGGLKKSRRIIVIDYAGAQKKNSSIDKKDLELIIRNVKHRRSEILEN